MRDKYLLLLSFAGAIALFTVLFQPTAKVIADGGDITTVAGTLGSSGASGDGGPATSARLASPVDVAIDSSGNIYISSHGNHAIRKVDGVLSISKCGTDQDPRELSLWRASAEFPDGPVVASTPIDRL